jgi:TPR repeat protein
LGVAKNEAEAVSWYRKAADKGESLAMFNLGHMLANGWGVSKNEAEAVSWYRKAARLGVKEAQDALRRRNLTW